MEINDHENNNDDHTHRHTEIEEGETILEIRNLDVKRGGELVLEDLSFDLSKGEILAVLGPNGSGKSTLLKTITGSLNYESGEVEWKGHHFNVSYLPEDLAPEKFREIPMSLREFFESKDVSEDKIKESLRDVGLDVGLLDRNPGQLSSGQFQRMIIAWSLVDDPDVLLFDEPTSSIDVGGEETIYSLLQKIWKERDLTIILVTHEINVVYSLATNVLCLRKKRVCYGPPVEVLTPEQLQELYGSEVNFYEHS